MPDFDRGSRGERPRKEQRGERSGGPASDRQRQDQRQQSEGPREHGRGPKPGGAGSRGAGKPAGQRGDTPRKPGGAQRGGQQRGDRHAESDRRGGQRQPTGGGKVGKDGPGDARQRRQGENAKPHRFDKPSVANRKGGPEQDRPSEPTLPEGARANALDSTARKDLLGLPKELADRLGRHLVAAGTLVDMDPARALQHARYARSRAGRIAIIREAAGIAAYHAGEWNEALSELRAYRRMTGRNAHLAVLADCERALSRPQRALEIAKEARGAQLDKAEAVELRIVAAGARRDLGQLDAAVVHLQGNDLEPGRRDPWSPRLFYAYADNLLAAGRAEEAVSWFLHAAEADPDGETDAAERAVEVSEAIRAPEHEESLESHRAHDDHG